MVKEMGADWEPWWPSLHKKSSHIVVKLLVSVLLIGVSFRLFFSHSATPFLLPVAESPTVSQIAAASTPPQLTTSESQRDTRSTEKPGVSDAVIPEMPLDIDEQGFRNESCDLFSGEWIPSQSGPAYTNSNCPFIEDPQNCIKNGRPDTGYLHWRWKPHDCYIPPFDAKKFLQAMRNKSWALIGDSIFRNHVQSLICLLSQEEMPVEVYHDKEYKSRRWRFPSHNFTLSVVWAPFLVKADIFENDDGESKSEIQLHLDTLDSKWTDQYHTFDYVVISGGQWFLKTAIYWENRRVRGCHHCSGKNLTELGLDYAYSKALRAVFQFVTKSSHKPLVLYRTWTPDHFENGEWFSGGTCNRTVPYRKGEYDGKDVDRVMYRIELEEFEKAAVNGAATGSRLKLLDTYHLSLLRADGHSGPYRNFHPFATNKNAVVQNDCLHWCLPGPIDSWNDLVMEMVMKK